MLATLRTWLDRLHHWWRLRDARVDYEIHRMTHKGGRKSHYPSVVFDLPMEKPTSDDEWPIDRIDGRFRRRRRVDGQIDEVIWTYTTATAEEFYERQRRRDVQLGRLEEMTVEEAADEYVGRTKNWMHCRATTSKNTTQNCRTNPGSPK